MEEQGQEEQKELIEAQVWARSIHFAMSSGVVAGLAAARPGWSKRRVWKMADEVMKELGNPVTFVVKCSEEFATTLDEVQMLEKMLGTGEQEAGS